MAKSTPMTMPAVLPLSLPPLGVIGAGMSGTVGMGGGVGGGVGGNVFGAQHCRSLGPPHSKPLEV